MGYGKWAFRESEVMPAGSYFSYTDLVGPGATFMRFTSGAAAPGAWRAPDVGRKSSGQWGAGVKYQLTEATDIGLYHLRYNELLVFAGVRVLRQFLAAGSGPDAHAGAGESGTIELPAALHGEHSPDRRVFPPGWVSTTWPESWHIATVRRC